MSWEERSLCGMTSRKIYFISNHSLVLRAMQQIQVYGIVPMGSAFFWTLCLSPVLYFEGIIQLCIMSSLNPALRCTMISIKGRNEVYLRLTDTQSMSMLTVVSPNERSCWVEHCTALSVPVSTSDGLESWLEAAGNSLFFFIDTAAK